VTGHTREACPELVLLGQIILLLRTERRMPQAVLARRAMLSESTVQRLEYGQLRPRRSTLVWVANALDPDCAAMIREVLIAAAGGAGALADDGTWAARRRDAAGRLMASGQVPLPSGIERRIEAHRQAAELSRRAFAIMDRPGGLDNARQLDLALCLMEQSDEARKAAGPGSISVGEGRYRVLHW